MDENPPLELSFDSTNVTPTALRAALMLREKFGGTVGLNLVLSGAVSPQDLTRFGTQVLGFEQVDVETLRALDRQTLAALPVELAFDGGLVPLSVEPDEVEAVVGVADPTDDGLLAEAALFAAVSVRAKVVGVLDLADVFPQLYGAAWRVSRESLRPAPDTLQDDVRQALEQAVALDRALNQAVDDGVDNVNIVVRHPATPGTIALSRSRRTAASTLERAAEPTLTEAERPRIKGKARGEARHYLEPVEEGEAVVIERRNTNDEPAGPSIIIDPSLLDPPGEPAAEPSSSVVNESSSIIIDMTLLEPEPSQEAEGEPAPTEHDEQGKPRRPVEVKLGMRSDVMPVVEESDDWQALGLELTTLDTAVAEEDWPFDVGTTSGSFPILLDAIESATQAHIEAAFRKEAEPTPAMPLVGETTIDAEPRQAAEVGWFNPFAERSAGTRVSDDLRIAMRDLRAALTRREALLALSRAVAAVYERGAVLALVADQAQVLAYNAPRSGARWAGGEPAVDVSQLPALLQLLDDPTRCFIGRLPNAASEALGVALPGGPALSSVICPIGVGERVVLMLYGDPGPGRESVPHPELWRLLLREVPTTLLRLALARKRVYRWQLR